MHKDLEKVLITEDEIHEAAKRLAARIEKDYEGEDSIVLVGLLKGSVQFMADLLKNINMMCTIDFMCVSSYGKGTKSTGRVNIIKDLSKEHPTIRFSLLKGFDKIRLALREELTHDYDYDRCEICGEPSSNRLCRACTFLEELEHDNDRL